MHENIYNDPLIDNKDSKKRYRADVLIEEEREKHNQKILKEIEKGRKKFGDAFDEAKARETNPNILREQAKIDEITKRYDEALNANDLEAMRQLILD